MDKREFLRASLAAPALMGLLNAPAGAAQPFPRPGVPVKLVTPFAAGGGTDTIARQMAPRLAERLGVPVIVENRPGAGGTLGTGQVARTEPDGHTVLVTITSLIQGPHLFPKLPYDPLQDLLPLALVAKVPTVFAVRADSPARSMAEFVQQAKAAPREHSLGNYGAGTLSNIQAAVLIRQTGADAVQVAYAGAPPLLRAIVSGEVAGAFTDIQSALPLAQAGRIRFLGVTGTEPVQALPGVPVLAGQGYAQLDLYGWIGLFLPSGAADAVAERLAQEFGRLLALPEIQERFAAMAFVPAAMDRAAFAAMVRRDYRTWGDLIQANNIRIDG